MSRVVSPKPKDFFKDKFLTWNEVWTDDNGNRCLLKVRQDLTGAEAPGTLFIMEPADTESGLSMYTRYIFPTDPYRQENVGYLAVFRGAINPNDPDVMNVQVKQIEAEVTLGTAVGTIDDLGALLVSLAGGVIHVAAEQLP